MGGWLEDVGRRLFKIVDSLFPNDTSPEAGEQRKQFNSTFDSAKRLSDFVGMIIRLSFVQFAAMYFLLKAQNTSGYVRWTFVTAGVMSLGVFIRLGMYIFRIAILYETRDSHRIKGTFLKVIFYLLALAFALASILGMYHLVGELARASALLSAL